MLTATYTLVALSVEQDSIRASLQSLQQLLYSKLMDQAVLNAGQVGDACVQLQNLYQNCHWRKVDLFLVPAIRHATAQADDLLGELDSLTALAGEALADVAGRAGASALESEAAVAQFCGAIEQFCSAMGRRLEREENELFRLARTVITGEAWFSIANHMLVQDAQRDARRPPRALPARRSLDQEGNTRQLGVPSFAG